MEDTTTMPPIKFTDVRLQVQEVKKRAQGEIPYFKLWVKSPAFPADQLTYVDTSEQQLLYSPLTYNGTSASNHSIVIKLVYESANVYTISSSVLPENELAVMGEIERIPKPIYDTRFATESEVKFYLKESDNGDQNFALYTHMDDDPKQKAYLLPVVDYSVQGQRQYVIRAIESPEHEEKDNFVFSASESDYPGVSKLSVISGSYENWCNIL